MEIIKEAIVNELPGIPIIRRYFADRRIVDSFFFNDFHESSRFWLNMASPADAFAYLNELYKAVFSIISKRGKKPIEVLNKHLSTIYTLALFLKMDPNLVQDKEWQSSIAQNIKGCLESYTSSNKNYHRLITHILHFSYMLMCSGGKSEFDKSILRPLLSAVTFTHDLPVPETNYVENLEIYLVNTQNSFDIFEHFVDCIAPLSKEAIGHVNDLEETGEFVFAFEGLKEMIIRSKFNPDTIVEMLVEKARFIRVYQKHSPYEAYKSAMACILVIRCLMVTSPISNPEQLRRIIEEFEMFRRWPFPVGTTADELIDILFENMRAPFTTYVFNLREKIPAIDFFSLENQQKSLGLKVHCLFDYNPAVQKIISQNQQRHKTIDSLDAHSLRTLLILIIFRANCKNVDVKFIEQFCSLDAITVFKMYCCVMNIIDRIEELISVKDARELLGERLESLMAEIQAKIGEIGKEKPNQKVIEFTKKNSSWLPSIFHYEFEAWNQSFGDSIGFMESQEAEGILDSRLKDTLLEQKRMDLPLHQKPVNLLVFGTQKELSWFINTLGKVYAAEPSLLINTDFRLFYIPTKECNIASYLAQNDYWYQRHVYVPFLYPTLEPIVKRWEGPGSEEIRKEAAYKEVGQAEEVSQQLPNVLNERLVQSFLLDAKRVLNVRVYQLECWERYEKGAKPNLTRYFCNYITIGLKNQNRKDKKKILTKDISIKTYSVEMNGDIPEDDTLGFSEATLNMVSFGLYNFPTTDPSYCGPEPAPNSNWLELVYLEEEAYKQEVKFMKDEKTLKKFQEQDIKVTISSLYTSLHVHSCEVFSKSEKFEIDVDGLNVGPYSHFKVGPVWANENKNHMLTAPFMTFVPINA